MMKPKEDSESMEQTSDQVNINHADLIISLWQPHVRVSAAHVFPHLCSLAAFIVLGMLC